MVSTFSLAPESGLAVSVMGNSVAGAAVGEVIRNALLGPAVSAPRAPFSQPELEEYVGRYRAGQWDIEVVEVDGQLDFGMRMLEDIDEDLRKVFEGRRTRVAFVDQDVVASVDDLSVGAGDFIRGSDGRLAFFRTGGRLANRLPS
jgi:hypothetical protein